VLLSIVIPTHNRFNYLRRCLEALCEAVNHAVIGEIHVVDDCSLSAVAEKNRELCKQRGVGYNYLEKNAGAPAARNRGIELSKGEWVAFLDDDVCVESGWGKQCEAVLQAQPGGVVGVEGRVIASGRGVWDREVENAAGGLYLSCHIMYRRETLAAAGKFDERFSSRYPSCEDHELACRMLMRGSIVFCPDLRVCHLPRHVQLPRYVLDAQYRMQTLLESELYFYLKHRDGYHTVRHARTFWGTYSAIALRHWYSTVRRRTVLALWTHPLQSFCLLLSCVLEQIDAVALFPRLLRMYVRPEHQFIGSVLDEKRTRACWRLAPEAPLTSLALKPRFLRSLLFPVTRLPVYSLKPFLTATQKSSGCSEMRLFLRIDDVFFNNSAAVELLCDKLGEKRIAYCAAVTGQDLTLPQAQPLLTRIQETGGHIGLHGFTHSGKFGPFNSELLQMNLPHLDDRIQSLFSQLPRSLRPNILIPPFNAINREQILHCARYFKIICGGPETVRFTDGYIGPIALPGKAWYFASLHPWYDTAHRILLSKALTMMHTYRGFACITVHMPSEASDGFTALMELIDRISSLVTPWDKICIM